MLKKVLTIVAVVLFTMTANAQQILEGNRVLTNDKCDITGVSLPGDEMMRFDNPKDKVTLEVVDFGTKGTTVMLNLNLASTGQNITFSWSGPKYKLMYAEQPGTKAYVLANASQQPLLVFSYVTMQGKQVCMAQIQSRSGIVTDLKKGMTVAELTQAVSGVSHGVKVKFSHKEGNLSVHKVVMPGMRDNWDGSASVTSEDYGHFYFDAQGKLVKWITLQ